MEESGDCRKSYSYFIFHMSSKKIRFGNYIWNMEYGIWNMGLINSLRPLQPSD
jgi:hypothetical protein